MIDARDLTFETADTGTRILDGITLHIERGARVAITGPSGSGKTTLAYHLCGVHRRALLGHTEGTLTLDGVDCTETGAPAFAGLVLQNPQNQLFCGTPREEIALGPENLGLGHATVEARTADLLQTMGLVHVADRDTASLSLGLQQRVSVASMLAIEPSVLVLDEPTNFLDPAAADSLFRLLDDLSRTRGMSVVVIEHDLRRLREWADLAVVLERGRIARIGAPRDVLPPDPGPAEKTRRSHAARTDNRPDRDTQRVLTVDRLSFAYSTAHPLLRDLSLAVRRGEIVALIGENGTGKSTLLKLVKGLLKPQHGTITVAGKAPGLDAVGLVFQNPDDQIFAHSVTEECAYVLRNRGMGRDACTAAARTALDAVGLNGTGERYPLSLSFGEKRRLTIASVLVDRPAILCLDEPTVALDGDNLTTLADTLAQTAEQGAAILFATHDIAFAHRVADRILELKNGRLTPCTEP